MTFSKILKVLEDYGPLTGNDLGTWPQDYINNGAFEGKIRDKHTSTAPVKIKRPRKTAKDLYGSQPSKRFLNRFLP